MSVSKTFNVLSYSLSPHLSIVDTLVKMRFANTYKNPQFIICEFS